MRGGAASRFELPEALPDAPPQRLASLLELVLEVERLLASIGDAPLQLHDLLLPRRRRRLQLSDRSARLLLREQRLVEPALELAYPLAVALGGRARLGQLARDGVVPLHRGRDLVEPLVALEQLELGRLQPRFQLCALAARAGHLGLRLLQAQLELRRTGV